jgi:hypothetical protein
MAYSIRGIGKLKLMPYIRNFGFSLRELMEPVVGFRIDDSTCKISNILQSSSTSETCAASESHYVFMLLENEFVKGVVYAVGEDKRLKGVRLETNLRCSQWFGQVHGVTAIQHVSTRYDEAIHALCGSHNGQYGAVLRPRKIVPEAPPSPEFSYDQQVVLSLDTAGESFGKAVGELGAIVVSVSTSAVTALRPLSRVEYQRYKTLMDYVDLSPSEHIIEFVDGERLLTLEWEANDTALVSIRFTTTHRETHWFGLSKTTWKSTTVAAAPPGGHICGLFGNQGGRGVTELSVVVARPIELPSQGPGGGEDTVDGEAAHAQAASDSDSAQSWEELKTE